VNGQPRNEVVEPVEPIKLGTSIEIEILGTRNVNPMLVVERKNKLALTMNKNPNKCFEYFYR
jgi:hypothetical protein